jgi:hypothetical protein
VTRSFVVTALVVLAAGCIVRLSQFDRYYANAQWVDAAREFAADSSLAYNEHELYRAGLLFGTPGRPPYDPVKARGLFSTLLVRFPSTAHRDEAEARLSLLGDLLRTRDDATRHERELETRIAELTRQTQDLRARADSTVAQGDSLRGVVSRLEAERREREEQLRALRLELQQLKEIDLKSRPPTKPIKPD